MVSSETAGLGACMLLMYNYDLRNSLSVLSKKVACKQMHGMFTQGKFNIIHLLKKMSSLCCIKPAEAQMKTSVNYTFKKLNNNRITANEGISEE